MINRIPTSRAWRACAIMAGGLLAASGIHYEASPQAARAAATSTAASNRRNPGISYTVSFHDLAAHAAMVSARYPTGRRPSLDLTMAIWSPGYYKVENYADRVSDVSAHTPNGDSLSVEHPARNHWRVTTNGVPEIVLTYRIAAQQRSVTTDWVGDSLIVLNGAPTFITIADSVHRPADIALDLPTGWRSATALDTVPDGESNHYRARDYDQLVDSPIVAGGNLRFRSFAVGASHHTIVDAGELDGWDSDRAAHDIARIVEQDRRFWGTLPYRRYVFLNVFRRGGGGLEHSSSTLLTSSAARASKGPAYLGWLNFVSHEYFHAMNVKRLRPIELGPFDYEGAPKTPSLWISEGLTTYYGDLMVGRAGLAGAPEFLGWMSTLIGQLQNTPGRLVQTLSASSLDAWNSENSGVGMDQSTTVSYYTKGTVVGLLLDARIRHLTNGRRSLDDVMRLAFARYSGAHGFTPEQFRAVTSEVAGTNLDDWFHRVLDTTEELDYTEVLEWYGLRFATADSALRWKLEIEENATPAQRAHLAALLTS